MRGHEGAAGAPLTLSCVEEASRLPMRPYPPPGVAESAYPAQLTVLVAILVELLYPTRLTVGPFWLIPSLEAALLLGLFLATPRSSSTSTRDGVAWRSA